ncbi:MAG: hypothetical protein BIFFINMI_01950 [Phycisphaerae bacterium]|nr:hypothetical protein [Phycisphaerae bacterium]
MKATWAMTAVGVLAGALLLGGCEGKNISEIVEVSPAAANDPLAKRFSQDPLGVLADGLKWYDANVKDYTCTLYKQERLDPAGSFGDEQKVLCWFKDSPFSVYTETVENPNGASKALYVEGKWDNRMRVRTSGLIPLNVWAEPRSALARAKTLRFIDEFGFKRSVGRMVAAFKTAETDRILKFKVNGSAKVGDRDTLVVESFIAEAKPSGRFDNPHLKLYIDRQWLLPLYVETWDAAGVARGRYKFVDVKFNAGLTDANFSLEKTGLK